MGYAARNFVPALPHWTVPMGGLAGYLLGLQEWSQFLRTSLCELIFTTKDAETTNKMLQWAMAEAWQCMRDYLRHYEPLVENHKTHKELDSSCELCLRHHELPDEYWWHTSEAARHVFGGEVYIFFSRKVSNFSFLQCTCDRCVRCRHWGHVSAKDGCCCSRCEQLRH